MKFDQNTTTQTQGMTIFDTPTYSGFRPLESIIGTTVIAVYSEIAGGEIYTACSTIYKGNGTISNFTVNGVTDATLFGPLNGTLNLVSNARKITCGCTYLLFALLILYVNL